MQRSWSAVAKGQAQPYRSFTSVPTKLATTMQDACSRIGDMLSDAVIAAPANVLEAYFELLQFKRLVDSFGPHSVFEVQVDGRGRHSRIGIRNVVPAPFLSARFRAARAVVLFSATLSPQRYYANTLGLPPETVWLKIEPPFSSDQLTVRIVDHVSTRFHRRAKSLEPIAGLIGEQIDRQPGNYLAFFSSFDYLESAREIFAQKFRGRPCVVAESRHVGEGACGILERLHTQVESVSASRCSEVRLPRASIYRAND